MRRRRPAVARVLAPLTAVLVLVLSTGAPAALAGPALPTVDRAAPTPTAPYPTGPPQGSAPDGSTVGGSRLDTRGLVVADGTAPLPAEASIAHGMLVADLDTGAVLAARDPHGRYYPASTLKTLTLLALAPVLDPATVVEGTAEDEAIEGSRVGLVRGGRYPVPLLLRALVMQSGNDAAQALARAAGGADRTVAAMNETARRLRAHDTVAGTPSGLDMAGQSSSPYDLALVFRRLVADPVTAAVLSTRVADLPAVGDRPGYQIQSQNPLLDSYPGDLGGKTGFTDAARHTFVTAAARDGRRLVVTLMQTERTPADVPVQAARLLDWAFATPRDTAGVGTLVPPLTDAPVSLQEAGLLALGQGSLPAATAAAADTGDGPAPWIGVVLAGAAVLVVVATWVGRRRAVRWVPQDAGPGRLSVRRPPRHRRGAPTPAASPPPSRGPGPGSSPSTRP